MSRKPFMPHPGHPRCTGPSSKLRYGSQAAAEHALAQALVHGSFKQLPRRAYHCDRCGGWHLTSEEKSTAATATPGRSYPDRIENPHDPPTVSGTDVTLEI